MSATTSSALDPRLREFLAARTVADEDRALEALVADIEPSIRAIIRRKALLFDGSVPRGYISRNREQAEDVCRAAILKVLEQLASLRSGARIDAGEGGAEGATEGGSGLRDVQAFAETITRNLLNEQLRRKYPNRTRLRRRVIYVLEHAPDPRTGRMRFSIWLLDRERLAGFLEWSGQRAAATRKYQQFRENPDGLRTEIAAHGDPADMPMEELIAALFRWLGSPSELDDLVGSISRLRRVEDHSELTLSPTPGAEDEEHTGIDPSADEPSPEEQAVMRQVLHRVWEGIKALPPQRCAVLLLNLTDHQGRGVVHLLPLLGIATLRQIAGVLDMAPEALAEVWNNLPLPDSEIARILGCAPASIPVFRLRARKKLQELCPDV